MTRRCLWRRAQIWLAGALLFGMSITLVGCRWIPSQRIDQELDPRTLGPVAFTESTARAANIETVPVTTELTLPALPRAEIAQAEVVPPPAATPLLDRALDRAVGVQAAVAATRPSEFVVPGPPLPTPQQPAPADPGLTLAAGRSAASIMEDQPGKSEHPADLKVSMLVFPAADERVASSEPTSTAIRLEPVPDLSPTAPEVSQYDEIPPAELSEPEGPPPTPTEPLPASTDEDPLIALRHIARKQAESGGEEANLWAERAEILDRLIADRLDPAVAGGGSLDEIMTLLAGVTRLDQGQDVAPIDDGLPSEPDSASGDASDPATLRISDLKFCRKVDGFGDYELAESTDFAVSAQVILYCEMEGVTYVPEGDLFRSSLESSIEIVGAHDEESLWRRGLGVAEDSCRRPRTDYFVNYQFRLPGLSSLPSGTYRLRLVQRDIHSDETASAEIPFRLLAR